MTQDLSRERRLYTHSSTKRVLLAEDDVDLRNLLAAALRRAGYSVLTAKDGQAMLSLFTEASQAALPAPDVIVMDIRMPRYSGIELLAALRLASWTIPVILITGFGDEMTHCRARDFGAIAVLDKPLPAMELIQAVEMAVLLNGEERQESVSEREQEPWEPTLVNEA